LVFLLELIQLFSFLLIGYWLYIAVQGTRRMALTVTAPRV
jgi:NADH:ubiquinone oxidoreductase subunit 5 (subunit L)/multisubunit Na+/H+ antiporter MnhA subunit